MKIAFVGLGHMGAPMARNLLKAGHAVTVFDLSADSVKALTQAGAVAASSPREAVANVEVVITMLPAAAHVRTVLCGEDGVLAGVRPGVLIIDSSTIDPATVTSLAALAKQQGNVLIDAPVSGGTGGAEAGTLTFMVGGDMASFEAAKPVLAGMGKNTVHCGPTGPGQVAKICNNLILGVTMAGVAEAMALGEALGIDPKVLAGVVNTSTGRSWSSEVYNPFPGVVETAPASKDYAGGFGTDLMLKDLGLATDAAKSAKQPAFMAALAQQLYQSASCSGDGKLDFSAVIKLYRSKTRVG
jgi:3-hydroxyisobutyrate dehydrogenase